MTYVEFFDRIASENISACLTYVPDRVILLGDNEKLMIKHIEKYKRVFIDRGYNIEFLFKVISKHIVDEAIEVLSEIVETYDDCVFDLTGGEEVMTFALGVVCSKYPDKNIQIHRFNIRDNTIYDCDKDGNTIFNKTPKLSIEENIRIFGGDVVYGPVDEDNVTYLWDLNSEFLNDVNRIWDICKVEVRYWNAQIAVFEAIEKVGKVSEDELTTVASRTAVKERLAKDKIKFTKSKRIIGDLIKYGLLTCFEDEDEKIIKISYKNKQVKKCLTTAGQALEMKVYTITRDIIGDDGSPVYNDALNGVVIDWDGDFHDEKKENVYDTENEIDVFLMHDIVPVFISCKSGKVTSEELYKLETVADRFGGKYSRKILVATSISDFGEQGKYLRQRAKDMKIKVIEDFVKLDDAALKKKFKNIWKS